MMTEYGYVEKPILEWLAGKPSDPADKGLGWRLRTEAEMAEFNRPLEDPLVERLLVPLPSSSSTLWITPVPVWPTTTRTPRLVVSVNSTA